MSLRTFMLVLVVGCSSSKPHPAPNPQGSGTDAVPETEPSDLPPDRISLVTSSVVVDACPDSKKLSSKQASREIAELVGPCTKIPGGAAHFSATLLPGGRVELASPSGDPDQGVVPTCVVQNAGQLRHKLALTEPCKFDIKLDERKEN